MFAGSDLAFSDTTTVHPIGLAVLILCLVYLLFTSKAKVILPILFMVAFIPSAQRVVVFTVDFTFVRILILFALMRIFMRGEQKGFKLNNVDIAIIFWMIWSILAYGILTSSFSGMVSRIGYMNEAFGGYLVGRMLVRDTDDIKRIVNFLGMASIPVAIFFLIERSTGTNMFSVFGGVPEETVIRGGRLRCQGPFLHPIMAGIFWASFLPWLGVMWLTKKLSTTKLIVFSFTTLFIIVNTASSTPVLSVAFVGFGFFLFYFRQLMPLIRVGTAIGLVFLHLLMERGVFHLISRIDIAGGSTGYHRYILIDEALSRVDEWWLFGTLSVSHWDEGLEDITNQYILEGVRGGLLEMLSFILVIVLLYKGISRSMRLTDNKNDAWLLWAIGTLMFMHVMNFLAASYFGSLVTTFYLFLGASVTLIHNRDRYPVKTVTGNKQEALQTE